MLLKEKMIGKRLILASSSPRRRELMEGSGLEFVMGENVEITETWEEGMTVGEIPLHLAQLKSASYPTPLNDNDILITADTLVMLGDRAMGKPKDRHEAIAMLTAMSGEQHTVTTGVVVRNNARIETFLVKTDVWFRQLEQQEIEHYVDNYNPYDKAGAYGIQEWIGYIGIRRIEGSFYNVMGLPIQSLYLTLEKFVDQQG